MEYLVFSLLFIVIHTAAYIVAGVIALKISKDLYEEKNRVLDYMRNMSNPGESLHVQKWFVPAQLLRGLLMSIVLYPVIGFLGELSFGLRFLFLAGLMFIYTDLACAVPFLNNIEGFVYMKSRYVKKELFGKLYLETLIYSVLFALFSAWALF